MSQIVFRELQFNIYCCSFLWQTPPLGWRISRSSSTDELVYVNEYNEEEVSMLLTDFQDN